MINSPGDISTLFTCGNWVIIESMPRFSRWILVIISKLNPRCNVHAETPSFWQNAMTSYINRFLFSTCSIIWKHDPYINMWTLFNSIPLQSYKNWVQLHPFSWCTLILTTVLNKQIILQNILRGRFDLQFIYFMKDTNKNGMCYFVWIVHCWHCIMILSWLFHFLHE